MFSPVSGTDLYEIRVCTPNNRLEVFGSSLTYRSYREAAQVSGAISDWIHLGVWLDAVLDTLSLDDQEDLFHMRQGLKADGVALGRVRVYPSPVCALYDPGDDDDDSDDPDRTDLEEPDILYLPRDPNQ